MLPLRFPLQTRVRTVLLMGVLFMALPCSLAAASVADVLRTGDNGAVSRGEFVRAAVQIIGIPAADRVLPYRRVPQSLVPSVQAAYAKGALAVFGEELFPARPILRGEALAILASLKGLSADPATGFRDLRGLHASIAVAVQVAIDQQWMEPQSSGVFGAKEILHGKDARILLRKVMGEGGIEEDEDGPPTIRINFTGVQQRSTGVLPKSQILEALWQIINDDYLHADKIDANEAAYSAAESIVGSLKDPYSVFYRPAGARDFQTRINGEVSGIGAQVEDKDGILTIVTPLTGSPAEKSGLKPGDQILAVDGVSIVGMPYEEAVDKVRGPKGSTVLLQIRRSGSTFDVSVMRDTIKVPEITISWQEEIAVVQLLQFGKLTDTDLRPEMVHIQEQEPKGIILDLRNNPGGLLHAATSVVNNFLTKGSPVAIIRSRSGEEVDRTDMEPTIDSGVPVVVLVNGGSASAAEIVAGALQDAGRVTVIGEKTFGKGTVQEVLEFNDQSSLKLTIAEWLTPKGRKIDGVGVQPDLVVPYSDRDDQMAKALEILKRRR